MKWPKISVYLQTKGPQMEMITLTGNKMYEKKMEKIAFYLIFLHSILKYIFSLLHFLN